MTDTISAPWTEDQVARLRKWQANPGVHPYTCGRDHKVTSLVPRKQGLICPYQDCDYQQDWVLAESLSDLTDQPLLDLIKETNA